MIREQLASVRLRQAAGPTGQAALFYLLFWGAGGVYLPFLNVYLIQLGLTGRQLGLLSALFPLMVLLLATPYAALADRRRQRVPMLQLAIVGMGLIFILVWLPRNFAWLALVLAGFAAARAPVLSLADSLIAGLAVRHGQTYGALRLWGSAGFALVAIICGLLWERLGYEAMFPIGSALLLGAAWVAGQLEEMPPPAVGQETGAPLSQIARNPGLMAILVATGLVGLTLGVGIIFEGIYVAHLGGGKWMIGLFMGIIAFSEVPAMQISSLLYRRLGGLRALWLAYALFGGAYLGFALVNSPLPLLGLAVVRGLGFGLFLAGTIQMLDAQAPPAWKSTVQSLRETGMFGLAPLLAAPLAGEMFDRWGPESVFIFGAAAAGLAAVVLLVGWLRGARY